MRGSIMNLIVYTHILQFSLLNLEKCKGKNRKKERKKKHSFQYFVVQVHN